VLRAGLFLLEYPFADTLYPGALDVIRELRLRAPVVIVTDGDAVYQVNKVERSGLSRAVDGDVLVYVHKELMLHDVERRYPARRYVMVEDKIRILAAMKDVWGDRLTTVFVRQGRFANDAGLVAEFPPPDVTIDRIGELVDAVSGL
jgi:FMN phosphatase YigB (HAD superfamily)